MDLIVADRNGLRSKQNVQVPYDPGSSETQQFGLDFLTSQTSPDLRAKVSAAYNRSTFKALGTVWYDIAMMTPEEARRFVEQKRENSRKQLLFFSFAVDRNTAIWISPLSVIVLLLFLALHLMHTKSAFSVDHAVIERFPWVAIFKSRLGVTVTYLSIGVLPILANCALDWRFADLSNIGGKASASLTAILLVLSGWLMFELHKFRVWFYAEHANSRRTLS